jgi:hypothetical protein
MYPGPDQIQTHEQSDLLLKDSMCFTLRATETDQFWSECENKQRPSNLCDCDCVRIIPLNYSCIIILFELIIIIINYN